MRVANGRCCKTSDEQRCNGVNAIAIKTDWIDCAHCQATGYYRNKVLVFWVEPLSVLSAIERFTPNIIYRVRTHRPVVALSFDDGPHPTFTLEVLEILHRHDAKATFFLIGERVVAQPEMER
jgi:hypothetical protein